MWRMLSAAMCVATLATGAAAADFSRLEDLNPSQMTQKEAEELSRWAATPKGFSTLFDAVFSYAASAKACGDTQGYQQGFNTIKRVQNFGDFHQVKSETSEVYRADPAYLTAAAVEQYNKQKWVTCAQIRIYVRKLDELTQRLL
jgi:hypothetical protein